MTLADGLLTAISLVGTFPTSEQKSLLEAAITSLNHADATKIAESVADVAARHPDSKGGAGHVIRALVGTPATDARGQPVQRVRDEVILAAIDATPWKTEPFRALGLLPPRLTPIWAASRVVERVASARAEIESSMDPPARVEGWLSLIERVEGTFEKKGTADLAVPGDDDVVRPLGRVMRGAMGAILRALVADLDRAPSVERAAVFVRAWKVLRSGWCEALRSTPAGWGEHEDDSARLASIANSRELAAVLSAHVEGEPASVRDGDGVRRLRFELAKRAGVPDVMRACVPAGTSGWSHHAAIVAAYGDRTKDASAYLKSLPTSIDRDRALTALLTASGSTDEALAMEIIAPATIAALAAKHGVPQERIVELGLEKIRRGDEGAWLEYLVRRSDFIRAKKIATRCHPEVVARVWTGPIPTDAKSELIGKAIDGLFAAKTVWRDAEHAKRVARDVLAAAGSDAAARKKHFAQTRKKVSKALDSDDYFLREVAMSIETELDAIERDAS